jgi:hypothetical protein
VSKSRPAAGEASASAREGLPLVRASDLATWAYCRRAWWLARVQNVAPGDAAPLEAGAAFHTAHGRALDRARWLRRLGIVLLVIALAGAAALLVIWFSPG